MIGRILISAIASLLLTATVASAQPPIKAMVNVRPGISIFKAASLKKPLVVESAEDAAKHFAGDALTALNKDVDFQQQKVLVFAWRGSGQDRLSYNILESYPEQIRFRYHPGRTRDLRPHVYVYALRANVTWKAP
jgi:hypothetical protein